MKKYYVNIIILIFITLFIMIFTLKDDFYKVIYYLSNMNYIWLILAFICMGLNILFQSFSIYPFLKEIKKNYKFKDTILLMTSALFFNAITPFSSGGQPFQMYILKKQGIKITDSGNALLQNFFTYQFALTIMGTFSIVMNHIFNIIPSNSILKNIVILGYIINLSILLIILFLCSAKKTNTEIFNNILNFIFKFIGKNSSLKEKISNKIDDFYNSAIYFQNNKKILIKSTVCNVGSLLFLYVIPLFIFFSIKNYNSLNIFESVVCSGYTFLIGSFVPIPGGTGGLEYGFINFFQGFTTGASLTACMIMWRFVTYYLGIIVGAISLLFIKKEVK